LSVLAAGRLQDARGFPRHAGHVSGTSRCHNQFNERMKYSTLRPSLKKCDGTAPASTTP